MPELLPIDASAVLLLLHEPPLTVLLRVIEYPTQTPDDPPMEDGTIFTVTGAVATQPVANV